MDFVALLKEYTIVPNTTLFLLSYTPRKFLNIYRSFRNFFGNGNSYSFTIGDFVKRLDEWKRSWDRANCFGTPAVLKQNTIKRSHVIYKS